MPLLARVCVTLVAALAMTVAGTSTAAFAARDKPHTVTHAVKGFSWSNGPYIGVKLSRTRTERLYDSVFGESVFAGVGVLCGTLTKLPYGWAIAASCVTVMTMRYGQITNALEDAHDYKKCAEFRYAPVGYNPFASPAKSVKCTWKD